MYSITFYDHPSSEMSHIKEDRQAATIKEAQKIARYHKCSFLEITDQSGVKRYYAFLVPPMNDYGSRRWYNTDPNWEW